MDGSKKKEKYKKQNGPDASLYPILKYKKTDRKKSDRKKQVVKQEL
jgi:hypothetical protein